MTTLFMDHFILSIHRGALDLTNSCFRGLSSNREAFVLISVLYNTTSNTFKAEGGHHPLSQLSLMVLSVFHSPQKAPVGEEV